MTQQVATNVHWHDGLVTREERMNCLKQRGGTVWFTGLSASGKSTIAVALEQVLCNQGSAVYRLDGDNIRQGLNKNLGFSAEDRAENIRRIGEVCKLFSDAGLVTLASFISPYKADRDLARSFHEEAGIPFLECYVEVPLDVAEERDPKGLYKKARAGEIKGFTGIDDPYEAPENAELVIPTADQTLEESVAMVLEGIRSNGLID